MIKLTPNEITTLKTTLKKFDKKSAEALISLITKYPDLFYNISDEWHLYGRHRLNDFFDKLTDSMVVGAEKIKEKKDFDLITDPIRKMYISQLVFALQDNNLKGQKENLIRGYWLMSDEKNEIETFINLQNQFYQLVTNYLSDNEINCGSEKFPHIKGFDNEILMDFLKFIVDNNNVAVFDKISFTTSDNVLITAFSNIKEALKLINNNTEISGKVLQHLIKADLTPEQIYRYFKL